jgi:ribonuclease R
VVAIADVSHYVREGTGLDEEALRRATSVYFPNHVLPMLPERLSNGICSLNPGVDRLCMVCDLELDGAGLPVRAELYEAAMRSHARCTYTQVAKVLAGERVPALDAVAPHLRVAGGLAKKLQARRAERGSLDFDLPEAKVVLDENMLPVAVVKRERNDAHRLVEEFMLAANEAVARYFALRKLPTVYRVHGTPNPEKLEVFATLARAQGFPLDVSEGISPKELNSFLRRLEGSRHQRALNSLLLRAMMQAVYSPENIGHFGLAATHYLHFTSPIRRYPDLMVHRLLKEEWARERSLAEAEREELEQRLGEVASISSERERASMQAERDIDAYFKCLFVQDRVGERFGATVVAVTDFGFFAELDDTAVEGLVRAEGLGTSWDLDPESYRLGFGSGQSFGIGDRVVVELASVNTVARRIDLTLVERVGQAVPPPRKKARGRREVEAALLAEPAFGVIAPAVAPALPAEVATAAGPAAAERGAKRRRARPEPTVDRVPRKPRAEAAATKRRPGVAGGPRRKLGAEPTAAQLPPRRGAGETLEAPPRHRAGKAPEAWAGSRSTWRPDEEGLESLRSRGQRTRTGVGADETTGRGWKRVGTEGFGEWSGGRRGEAEERRGRGAGKVAGGASKRGAHGPARPTSRAGVPREGAGSTRGAGGRGDRTGTRGAGGHGERTGGGRGAGGRTGGTRGAGGRGGGKGRTGGRRR